MERGRTRSNGNSYGELREYDINNLERTFRVSSAQVAARDAETLAKREQFYLLFEKKYTVRTESVMMGKPGGEVSQSLIYYRLEDILALLGQSDSRPSKPLFREIADRSSGQREMHRERIVSALEKRGLVEKKDYLGLIIDCLQKQLV